MTAESTRSVLSVMAPPSSSGHGGRRVAVASHPYMRRRAKTFRARRHESSAALVHALSHGLSNPMHLDSEGVTDRPIPRPWRDDARSWRSVLGVIAENQPPSAFVRAARHGQMPPRGVRLVHDAASVTGSRSHSDLNASRCSASAVSRRCHSCRTFRATHRSSLSGRRSPSRPRRASRRHSQQGIDGEVLGLRAPARREEHDELRLSSRHFASRRHRGRVRASPGVQGRGSRRDHPGVRASAAPERLAAIRSFNVRPRASTRPGVRRRQ